MKLEFKTSLVTEIIQLIPCGMGTKVNVRTCGYNITLNITKIKMQNIIENKK